MILLAGVMYKFMCPIRSGIENDPRINLAVDPNLKSRVVQEIARIAYFESRLID